MLSVNKVKYLAFGLFSHKKPHCALKKKNQYPQYNG